MGIISNYSRLFRLTLVSWVCYGIIFLFQPPENYLQFIGLFSMLLSIIVAIKSPIEGLYLLPFPLLLGPISPLLFNFLMLTIGDIYSLFLILIVFTTKKIKLTESSRIVFFTITILLLISTLFSNNISGSIIGLVRTSQYLLLAYVTNRLISTNKEIFNIFYFWAMGSVLVAIIILWAYFNFWEPLLWKNNENRQIQNINLDTISYLYRPTYFYTNIWLPLNLSLIYIIYCLTKKGKYSFFMKLVLISCSIIILITIIINNSKSILFADGIVALFFLLYMIFKNKFLHKLIKVIPILILMGVLLFSMYNKMIPDSQRDALFNRMNSSSSLQMRFSVWENVFNRIGDNIPKLIIGHGPQSAWRGGINREFYTGVRGNTEGAFDSTPISIILENGIIIFFIITFFFFHIFLRIWKYWKLKKESIYMIFLIMFSVSILAHLTQQFAFNPASLSIVQVLAIMSKSKFTS